MKKFEPSKMVNWFDARQLLLTGVRTIVSGTFGNYADRREMQAALVTEMDPCDYSSTVKREGGIWIDYISDTGDGFNSTNSIAASLAAKELRVQTNKGVELILPKSKVIVMGGDQVYPTPQNNTYLRNLVIPFTANFPTPADEKDTDPYTHLYAIPGNHDWYDGLSSFIKLFCQKRKWGGLITKQSRSYFAVKLNETTWIWGTDIQLDSDIDLPQLTYYKELAATIQKGAPGSKIILCTAEPAWVYKTHYRENKSYERLRFFIDTCIEEYGLEVIVTVTGDIHHYSRYAEHTKEGKEFNHKITAGGGGSFLHPTHFLQEKPEKLTFWKKSEQIELKSVYPDKKTSKKLAFRNLLFPFINWQFSFLIGFIYMVMANLLQTDSFSTAIDYAGGLKKHLIQMDMTVDVLMAFFEALVVSPSVIILLLVLVGGIFAFADRGTPGYKWAVFAGALNALAHFALFPFVFWLSSMLNNLQFDLLATTSEINTHSIVEFSLFSLQIFVIGGLLGSLIMGLYLLSCILFVNNHYTEAFSSFHCSDYKNFIRFHITSDTITIYPIGINSVTKKWNIYTEPSMDGSLDDCIVRITGDLPVCHLIEDPIIISLT
ncbi:MAG: metallophosphoesterase [Cytophagales bacterium]|nr:metallophosphoesterase [Cytophaga sp.]